MRVYIREDMEYLFRKININAYFRNIAEDLEQELRAMESQMFKVNKRELSEYIINKFLLTPIEVDWEFNNIEVGTGDDAYKFCRCMDVFMDDPRVIFTFRFPFNGSRDILNFDIRGRYSVPGASEDVMEDFSLERSSICITTRHCGADVAKLASERDIRMTCDKELWDRVFILKQMIAYVNGLVEKQNVYIYNTVINYVEAVVDQRQTQPERDGDIDVGVPVENRPRYIMDDEAFMSVKSAVKDFALGIMGIGNMTDVLDPRGLRAAFAGMLHAKFKGATATGAFCEYGDNGIAVCYDGRPTYLLSLGYWENGQEFEQRLERLFAAELWPDCKVSLVMYYKNGKSLAAQMSEAETVLSTHKRRYGKVEQVCEAEKLYKFNTGRGDQKKILYVHFLLLPLLSGTDATSAPMYQETDPQ